MNINTSDNGENLVVTFTIDSSPLQEKLELFSQFKVSFFEHIIHSFNCDLSSFAFNLVIENNNIITSHFVTAICADESDKLVCVLDLDVVNFIRELVIAMRAIKSH